VLATDAACGLLLVVATVAGWRPFTRAELLAALALAVAAALAARAVVPWVSGGDLDGSAGGQVIDLSSLVFVLAALLAPLALVPLVCLPSFVLDRVVARRALFAVVLNALALTAITVLAAAARLLIGDGPPDSLRWAVAAGTAAVVYTAGAYGWAIAGRWLVRGVLPRRRHVRDVLPLFQEAAMAATAVLGATLWRITPLLVVYMIGPVAVLQRLLYFREVQVAARTDGKTGLLNYRWFEECARREISRARRAVGPLALLVVDMDRLRDVNSAFGHQGGDQALRHVAASLAGGARRDDLVCRFGGEEFLVLLPGTHVDAASEVAERLRHAIRTTPLRIAGREVRVSVSIGVAGLEEGAADLEALVALADTRLYAAKEAGRDRVVSSSPVGRPSPTGGSRA
jgi:diguanylate cyclase (GGDEF)-like protein